jgi:hypothetical protein
MISQPYEVSAVASLGSTKVVAGEIFPMEASRIGMAGIYIDGPVCDDSNFCRIMTEPMNSTTKKVSLRVYASHATPYRRDPVGKLDR